MSVESTQIGLLAKQYCGVDLPVQVLRSAAGFYLGTQDSLGFPVSRESVQYWRKHGDAKDALDQGSWTQRQFP
jgi:hypothetical protein